MLLILDALIVLFIFFLSYAMRIVLVDNLPLETILERMPWLVVPGVIIHLLAFYVFGLYESKTSRNKKLLSISVFLSVACATTVIALLSFAFPKDQIGRVLTFFQFILMNIGLISWRVCYNKIDIPEKQKVLVIGWNELVEKIRNDFTLRDRGYELAGVLIPKEAGVPVEIGNPIPVFQDLDQAFEATGANIAVVVGKLSEVESLKPRLLNLKFQDVEVYPGTTFYELALGKVPVSEISEGWLLYSAPGREFHPVLYQPLKRLFDLSFSGLALLILSPMFLILGFLIRLDSKGPVFFRQERLGLNRTPFTLYKFRTMIDDAEMETGPCWAYEDDKRFTRLGRFLRKTRLDELPQFVNVFRGEMSLVGPRPIRDHFADILAEKFQFYRLRFKVKPGITGWAQVNMNYVNTDEDQYDKLEHEMYYIYNQSLILDMFILLKTAQAVIRMKGG